MKGDSCFGFSRKTWTLSYCGKKKSGKKGFTFLPLFIAIPIVFFTSLAKVE